MKQAATPAGGEGADDLDRALAALWRISMTAETASVNDPPWLLPNQIRHLADIGMGKHRRRAQELAADDPPAAARSEGGRALLPPGVKGATVGERQYIEVDCPACKALVDQNLVTACASVGIENGRSAGAELLLYLGAQHDRLGHEGPRPAASGPKEDG